MRGLIVACAFLTRLPVPRVAMRDGDFGAAIRWYPAVGLIVGGAVAGACYTGARVDPWLGALCGLAAWVAVTGALHIDGLADVADGLGAAHGNRERLLSVMADPHVGSFGVTAIVLQLAAKLVLLHLLAQDWVALLFVPFAARIGPLAWARLVPVLKPEGLGFAIAGAVRMRDPLGWLAVLAAAAAVVAPFLLAAPLLILLYPLWVRARIGGMTGDVHGAGIELVEAGLLVSLLVTRQL